MLGVKGRVLVVNAILVPKLVYVLQMCPVPGEVLVELSGLISGFLWRSSAATIAHRTIIGPIEHGGLGLVDLRVKIHSLRLKLMSRLLDDTTDDVWQAYLREDVLRRGACGMHNLCSFFFADRKWLADPLFQEVAEAWVAALPSLHCVVADAADVLAQPLFGNPWLGGRQVMAARRGEWTEPLVSVVDVVDGSGRVSVSAVCERLGVSGVDVNRGKVRRFCRVLDECLTDEWRGCLQNGGGVSDGVVRFTCDDVDFESLRPRHWYKRLVRGCLKPATALVAWGHRFPGRAVLAVWHTLKEPYLPPAVFHSNFKLLHRRVFTSVVLHQIQKTVYSRTCAVCGRAAEDFDHFFLTCGDVLRFRAWVRRLLVRRCGVGDLSEQQWDWVWCFGLGPGSREVGVRSANFLLLCARHVLFLARNIALYEGRRVCRVAVFTGLVGHYFRLMFESGRTAFEAAWCREGGFCSVDGRGKLVLDFG